MEKIGEETKRWMKNGGEGWIMEEWIENGGEGWIMEESGG